MKGLFIYLIATMVAIPVAGQNPVDSVLSAIETNNTTLSALRKSIDADKLLNKTGLLPRDPEVEFNYLWGNPSAIGNRTDISVRQEFDFPTAYAYRSRISGLKIQQSEPEYQKQRREILLQARLLCADLVYQNALLAEYAIRLDNAQQIAGIYERKLETGETNILEFNKARMHLVNLSKEMETIRIERSSLLASLARLNGGVEISFNQNEIFVELLTADFEQWYALAEQSNPALQWLKQELAIAQYQEHLQVAQNLPGFSAGYMSEKVVGQQFRGLTLGISIPLWENKNTLKYARAKTMAVEALQADSKLQLYNEMKTLHTRALSLQNSIIGYRSELDQFSNRELLTIALNKGEISLGEYFIELSFYYESRNRLIEMGHSLNKAYSELLQYL